VEVERQVEASRNDDASLAAHRRRGGHMRCVECQESYSDAPLARALPDGVFAAYRAAQDAAVEHRVFLELQERFMSQQLQPSEGRNEEATREMLQREYPNAVQCPSCGAGPVVPEACWDLSAHHGQNMGGGRGRVSNACPACGFFARERAAWHPWDGRMRQAAAGAL